VNAGYSILTYDRLGTGLSDKLDAYTVVQAPLELEILRSLTEMARSGELPKHAKSSNQSAHPPTKLEDMHVAFNNIIHVGHSFGSILTSAFLTTYGNLSDAAVITGYIVKPYLADLKVTILGLTYAR
jgi:pimeloyl-ACP methyl ester carboxylesterase